MAKKVKKNQTAIHVAFSIVLIVVVYALVQLIIFLRQPTNSTLVRNGEIVEAEEVIGYIIRDEVVLQENDAENEVVQINGETTVLTIILEATEEVISTMSGKIGNLKGMHAKVIYEKDTKKY